MPHSNGRLHMQVKASDHLVALSKNNFGSLKEVPRIGTARRTDSTVSEVASKNGLWGVSCQFGREEDLARCSYRMSAIWGHLVS